MACTPPSPEPSRSPASAMMASGNFCWFDRIRDSVRPFADLLFPRICLVCEQTIPCYQGEAICSECVSSLISPAVRCLRCSAPVPGPSTPPPKNCRLCKSSWDFRRAYCMCVYRGSAAKVARKMKLPGNAPLAREAGELLGGWFADRLATQRGGDSFNIDLIVPVSQHWLRRYRDRYNQADILAAAVGKALNKPVSPRCLIRSKWTEKQGTKTIQERLKSLRGTMLLNRNIPIQGKRILVVDDILTSGATASEAARALKSGGCKSVDVLAFARGSSSQTR